MEYGLVSRIDQYSDNKSVELEQIHASTSSSQIGERNNLSEVRREEFLKAAEASKAQEVKNEAPTSTYEYTLTNTNFGFNDSSKDFYVKAVRGEAENQYPTADMMKLKAFFLNQASEATS